MEVPRILVLYLLLLIFSFAESGLREEEVDKTLRTVLACNNNPGMAVSVVKDGRIVFSKGYGVKNMETKVPVSNKTLFGIASLSKAFASTLLVKLLHRTKEITLDTEISRIYNDDNIFSDDLRSRYVTIRDLLAHNIGIRSNNYMRFDDSLTRGNIYRRFRFLRSRGRFRESFYYSNLMYGVITDIAERIGRKSWEDLVREELLNPIGMSATTFATVADEKKIDLATGYIDFYGEIHPVPFKLSRVWGNLCGSGCVMSSANDMAKWMMFHLDKGRNSFSVKVVEERALAHTHKAHNTIAKSSISKYFTKPVVPHTHSQTNYALGWKNGYYRGYEVLTHSGSTWGYRALITLFPAMRLGIYTSLTGEDYGYILRTNLHNYLADKYLDETPWLNGSTICSFPEPWFRPGKEKSKPLIDKTRALPRNATYYVGEYENSAYGRMIVTVNGTTGKLIIKYGVVTLGLYPKALKNEFHFETLGFAAFVLNFGTIKFKMETKSGYFAAFEVTTFDTKDPPDFRRFMTQNDPPELSNTLYVASHRNSANTLHSIHAMFCLMVIWITNIFVYTKKSFCQS
ncbi:uncharacterized protein [Argopecten irradians]|uniref:uncharacterized protein n=1 Tax=Argopecten irradians TaxID=31199 RepID=UPI003719373E